MYINWLVKQNLLAYSAHTKYRYRKFGGNLIILGDHKITIYLIPSFPNKVFSYIIAAILLLYE